MHNCNRRGRHNVLIKLLENINGPLENMKSRTLFILTIQKMS